MPRPAATTMTVGLGGTLSELVSANMGEDGSYENVSEYMRDLIRRDKERVEREAWDCLNAQLAHAYATPEPSHQPLTAADVSACNRI